MLWVGVSACQIQQNTNKGLVPFAEWALNESIHQRHVVPVAISPKGTSVVAASKNGELLRWEMPSEKLTWSIKTPHSISSIRFSHNGSDIVVAYMDGNASIFDEASGKERHALNAENATSLKNVALHHASFSPDDKYVVTVGDKGLVLLWNAASGELLHWLEKHENLVMHAAFSPDGKTLATVDTEILCLWEVGSEKLKKWIPLGQKNHIHQHDFGSLFLAFSPTGRVLALAEPGGILTLLETKDYSAMQSIQRTKGDLPFFAFSADEHWLMLFKTMWIRSENGINEAFAYVEIEDFYATRPLVDSRWQHEYATAIGQRDRYQNEAWLPSAPSWLIQYKGLQEPEKFSIFDPDALGAPAILSPHLLNGYGEIVQKHAPPPPAHAWKQESAGPVKNLDKILFSKDKSSKNIPLDLPHKIPGPEESMLHIEDDHLFLESSNKKTQWKYTSPDGKISWVEFSVDGKKVLIAGKSTAVVLETRKGKKISTLKDLHARVIFATFSPDGRWILTGTENFQMQLWMVQSGKRRGQLPALQNAVATAAIANGGLFAATIQENQSVQTWNLRKGSPMAMLRTQYDNPIKKLTLSGDGKKVATFHKDKTLHLWDATTGIEVRVLGTAEIFTENARISFGKGNRFIQLQEGKTLAKWPLLMKIPSKRTKKVKKR